MVIDVKRQALATVEILPGAYAALRLSWGADGTARLEPEPG